MTTREIFRENLKFYRKTRGISQEKLSEMIGYGITYITEIESRKKFPKPETIDLIAEKLGIQPYQFFLPKDTAINTDNKIEEFATDLNLANQHIQSKYLV